MMSMTGFGRGESQDSNYIFQVEIKSVNHRYNDISIRMPRYLNYLEDKIKKEIKKYIKRGRVDVFINLNFMNNSSLNINLDLDLAREAKISLEKLCTSLDIKQDLKINDIMKVADFIKIERELVSEDEVWDVLFVALENSLLEVSDMRSKEGQVLKKDMVKRLEKLEILVKELETRRPYIIREYQQKLEKNISLFLNNRADLDEEKIINEVAHFADKSDIQEEITRIKSHLDQYLNIINEKGVKGRKLDFLIQEINREVNTVGSKTGDSEITSYIVDIKSEVEKLREQVQNIE